VTTQLQLINIIIIIIIIFCTSFEHFDAVRIGPLNSEPFTKISSHFLIIVGSATSQLLLHFSRPLMQCLDGRRFRSDEEVEMALRE